MLRTIRQSLAALCLGCALILPFGAKAVTETNAYVVARKSAYECVTHVLQKSARTVSVKFDYSERFHPKAVPPESHVQLIFPPLPFIEYSYRTSVGDVLTVKTFVMVGDRGEFELGFSGADSQGNRITLVRTSDRNPYFNLTHELWKDCQAAYSGDVLTVDPITVIQIKPAGSN